MVCEANMAAGAKARPEYLFLYADVAGYSWLTGEDEEESGNRDQAARLNEMIEACSRG